VRRVWFDGDAPPAPDVVPALEGAELVVIGPSNPYVSIDPILTRPGVREALSGRPIIAVSPIVGGRAIKGPLGEMIPALAREPASAGAVARHYGSLLLGFVMERGDEASVRGPALCATETVMQTRDDRARLARQVLAFAETIAR
jgi:LPPG:FO 2-phospho-L-lactate transferase